jgi:hypothetical protein
MFQCGGQAEFLILHRQSHNPPPHPATGTVHTDLQRHPELLSVCSALQTAN